MEKELKAFRKLIVWQRAHELTLMIYKAGEKFPKHELFGLTSQIRRSAVSVGSLAETEIHIEIAHDLGYLPDDTYEKMTAKAREVGYLLSRLKLSIENNSRKKS